MTVRLRDVAEAVGVSAQVVSKVLNGGSSSVGASPDTRSRIERAARELGYRRNAAGLALRKQSFQSVGVLMGAADQSVFMPQMLTAGLVDTLADAGYTCTLMSAGRLDAASLAEQRLLNERLVDALVLALSEDPDPALVSAVRKLGVPAVWMHRDAASNSVGFDEHAAAADLVDHLVERGHRSIAYLDYHGPEHAAPATRLRLAGFDEACERHGLPPRRMMDRRVERPDRAAYTRRWLGQGDRPDAVIVGSCSAAQVILDTAHQLGIAVPDDLAIATFDNGGNATANDPALTAAVVPERELGRAAGEMALALAGEQRQRIPSRRLRCPVIAGGTT